MCPLCKTSKVIDTVTAYLSSKHIADMPDLLTLSDF